MGRMNREILSQTLPNRVIRFPRIQYGRTTHLTRQNSLSHQTKWAQQRPETLGKSLQRTNILKDYNGQTIWLSFNIHSFTKDSFLPKWLSLAVGYGGEIYALRKHILEALQNRYFSTKYIVNFT